MQNYDKATYQQLVSEDAVLVNSLGETKSKKQELASLERSPDFWMEAFSTKDVKVRVCGETNIVITGKDVVKFKVKGEQESNIPSFWFTRAYEKRGGQWQLVFQQLTLIKE